MEKCYLRVEISFPLTNINAMTWTIPIDSENDNLIECIRSVVGENCTISFQKYYENTDLMNFKEMFPYIVVNETINWCVPYSDVTIKSFRDTHHLEPDDPIYAEIDNYGGGGDEVSEVISWIINNWDTINFAISSVSSGITIGGFIQKIYKYFANKKQHLPRFEDVKELILRKDRWHRYQLMKLFAVNDQEIIDFILQSAGYERTGESFVKVDNNNCVGTQYNSNDPWGKVTCNRLTGDLTVSIQHLNMLLTDLKLRSENLGIDCFSKVDEELDKLCDKWQYYLKGGDDFCFVMLVGLPDKYDRLDLDNNINSLSFQVQELLDEIAALEELGNKESMKEFKWKVNDIDIENRDDFDIEDEEIDEYISPWEMLLTKLYLSDKPFQIKAESDTFLAYVEQIYDTDLLLQVLSESGSCIGYQTINISDIKMVTTDTKDLIYLEKEMPKKNLSSLSACDSSAKEFLVDYAAQNSIVLTIALNNLKNRQLIGRIIGVDTDTECLNEGLVKVQLLGDSEECHSTAWIEMTSIDWIRIN